jgi:hypothetical protein
VDDILDQILARNDITGLLVTSFGHSKGWP